MDIYCKNCKRYTEWTHPKTIALISDKKANKNVLNIWLIEGFLIK